MTVDIKANKMGIEIIICNDMGAIMACLSTSRPFFSYPIIVESWALLRAMELCSKLNFYHMDFEGDAKVHIQAIARKQECLVWYGELIEEIKCLLKMCPNWSMSFYSRKGNCAAYVLTKYGLSLDQELFWIKEMSIVLIFTIISDLPS